MTNPLPNADEPEVVALFKERDGQTFDGEVHLSSAEAAAVIAQIKRLTRERDEARRGEYAANEHEPTWCELVAVWKTKAEAAEAKVKRLREALEQVLAANIKDGSIIDALKSARTALSGGTSNG